MCSKISTTASTNGYWDKINRAKELLQNAGRVLVGVASGLSAAGGLNYFDPELVRQWFPEYYRIGFRSLPEIQSVYWELDKSQPERYWGYWARHIDHIRYQAAVTRPYMDLKTLLDGKEYFIASTNADGQLEKAGFPRGRIYAPQGDHRYLQCAVPCREEVFDNADMIRRMVDNMPNAYEVRTGDIPYCPHCGAPLVPNLRCDNTFVEAPHIFNTPAYEAWLNNTPGGNLLLLELGVGYQTPGIIRFPFESSVRMNPGASLVRVNMQHADIPEAIQDRAVGIQADIGQVLRDLLEG